MGLPVRFKIPRLVVWPWHSVFWKIFLWFWLTMIAMLVTLFLAFAVTVDPSDFLSERRALFRELEIAARKMELLSRTSVHLPIPRFPGSGYYLFDTEGNILGSASISEELISAYNKTRNRSDPTITFRRGVVVVGPQRITLNDAPYELYLTKEMPVLVHWRVKQIIARQWHLIILALGVSFFLCVVLARYLVGPIRNLQRASRKLARGDLSARVDGKVARRRDELGELARDFDHMAEQVGSLVFSKERLLRDVSHELRSPLTRLQISLALARRKTPDAEAEHARIEREIERLDQLIGQIIHFSRIQHNIANMGCEKISLEGVLKKLVDDGNFEAQAKDKAVVFKETANIELVAVPEFLSSAVENIIRNAIRFTPEGSEVEVRLFRENDAAFIRIRDYGPGVPEEALEDLFEPFFRVDETRGKENDGTGLGMAIASTAVAQHSGSIVARNAHPGLEVTIRLPLRNGLSV
ncbi:ATP-binding protein [Endozoicomonas sp. SCSIO W0465]|uniref:ATP-binding protein n=1 Tax=Endozoicomonas sp. SCSIO W0465 TaxID=2918516 RepID=UPI0020765C88|nr:ATP-binding protein [Endozoicomonas sp. SCSIO W0465]USE35024.1 ATP-binding protein [Endozoicomonas sp. SCSIO W0465]